MSHAGIISVTSSSPCIPIQFTEDVGVAVPVANNLNIVGGIGISTSGSGDTVTINATSGGFTWTPVTSVDNTVILVAQNGYIAKGGAQVIFQLPAAAAVGDEFWICGYGNLWTLTQNANQQVFLGSWGSTTIGVGGSVTATHIKDTILLVCVTANLEFQILSSVGNLSFV